jgi:hypothetical protein
MTRAAFLTVWMLFLFGMPALVSAKSSECSRDCGRWRGSHQERDLGAVPQSVPYRSCFISAGRKHGVSPRLLASVAYGESDFNPTAVSDKGAIGVMQIRWPVTARHLGVGNRWQLFDACTNIDAGARYLKELSEKYAGNTHYMLAAYFYGPSRIDSASLPAPAAQYSDYIYERHLALDRFRGSPLIIVNLSSRHSARRWRKALSRSFPDIQFSVHSNADGTHGVRASGTSAALREILSHLGTTFTP